jgi:hypothetical protein
MRSRLCTQPHDVVFSSDRRLNERHAKEAERLERERCEEEQRVCCVGLQQ